MIWIYLENLKLGYLRPPPIQPYLYHEEYNSIPDNPNQKEGKILEKEKSSQTRNVWITMGNILIRTTHLCPFSKSKFNLYEA